MKARWFACTVVILIGFAFSTVLADSGDANKFPKDATFTTLITLPRPVEGLTGDGVNNLYIGGSGAAPCPIWQINLHSPSMTVVGRVQASAFPPSITACAFSGITFDELGNLYQADGTAGQIYTFKPNAVTPPNAIVFASGVPGTNGLAFDRDGNLWTGDGTTGQGRVWKIPPCATPPCPATEVFRIQPMAATTIETTFGGGITAVGRDIRALPPGIINPQPTSRNAAVQTTFPPCANAASTPCALGSQPLVANGIAFDNNGDTMFVIDTARGALWKVDLKNAKFNPDGTLKTGTGCDPVFTADTLCLSNIFVAHAILEGGDGIALDKEGNIYVDANERDAVAIVTKQGEVFEIFRNPVNTDSTSANFNLRNSATKSTDNNRILEFPTSPFLTGKVFCTSMSDGNRRDNSPNTGGEIVPGTAILGKISCMDQELKIPGLPLPIH